MSAPWTPSKDFENNFSGFDKQFDKRLSLFWKLWLVWVGVSVLFGGAVLTCVVLAIIWLSQHI